MRTREIAQALKRCRAEIIDLRAKSVELVEKEKKLLNLLQGQCRHKNKESKSKYFPGGYYDRAATVYTVVCADCEKVLETREQTHSWYG